MTGKVATSSTLSARDIKVDRLHKQAGALRKAAAHLKRNTGRSMLPAIMLGYVGLGAHRFANYIVGLSGGSLIPDASPQGQLLWWVQIVGLVGSAGGIFWSVKGPAAMTEVADLLSSYITDDELVAARARAKATASSKPRRRTKPRTKTKVN